VWLVAEEVVASGRGGQLMAPSGSKARSMAVVAGPKKKISGGWHGVEREEGEMNV